MDTTNTNIEENLGISTGKRRWRKLGVWLVMLLLLALGGGFLFDRWKASAQESPVRYRTESARMGDLTVTVTATGQLQSTRDVSVGSEVSGIIDSVEVNYNDFVKVGQVLARINTEKLDAQVAQDKAMLETARAKVADAKVTVAETEAEYQRMMAVRARSNNQLPSQHDVDTSKAAYERAKVAVASAQATVSQAEANLAIDQTNVTKAVIRSPVNGVVMARNVEPGQTIAAQFNVTTMFQLAEDLTRMKLQVNIDEADVGVVQEGQPVKFTVDAYPGRQFPGQIKQLRYQSTTSNNVVTYIAVIGVDNREMLLRPGMTATATITVKSAKNVLLVPNIALRFNPTQAGPTETADNRSFIRKLMPGPPPMPKRATDSEEEAATAGSPHVWVLAGDRPVPVAVKTGLTNGKLTEIQSLAARKPAAAKPAPAPPPVGAQPGPDGKPGAPQAPAFSGTLTAGTPLVVELMKVER
jgi:HlyD family secretion protein